MTRLGIYVQVPFCQTKCTYCNFHTGVVSAVRFAPYAETVCREIRGHRELLGAAGVDWPGRLGRRDGSPLESKGETRGTDLTVDTVYFGGGTPSLLDAAHLQKILEAIRESFATELAEVTLEADPETIEAEKAGAWVRAGINRVSFGSQSFVDKELVAAGRMHRRADIYRAVPALREVGIFNIRFDLIAGLPHQTKESWRQSLEELQAAGYHHYEISNWAKPGFESKHNLKYWRREAYLGFGAGAHSFSGTERWANAHEAAAYVSAVQGGGLPVEQQEKLTAESALEEELFLGLRQLDGIDLGRIEREYGVTLASRFDPLMVAGLVERDGGVVRLARNRLAVSNEVFVELMK